MRSHFHLIFILQYSHVVICHAIGTSTSEKRITKTSCESILAKVSKNTDVPYECEQYPSVKEILRKRDSNRTDHAIAFEGMSPQDAHDAMAAREKGHLSPIQIKRRMTNTSHTRIW